MISRRTFIAAAAAVTGGCAKRKASGFPGFAFIANQEGQAVAAVDLTVFAVARLIHLAGSPTSVIAHPKLSSVFALTPATGTVHEIHSDTLAFSRKLQVCSSAVSMRLSHDAAHLFILCGEPRQLVRIDLEQFQPDRQIKLPAVPLDFDLDQLGKWIAVSYGPDRLLTLLDASARSASPPLRTSGDIGVVRFQRDSLQLIAANLSGRMLSIYQVATGKLIVNLPLAVRPDHLCFNSDGGQLFVTGEGGDAVVVVFPYFTPYVAETVLAGHAPGPMAATFSAPPALQYLFVANPKSGDVSILDIRKRRVIAVTPVGAEPGQIIITPDDQYALVLNQRSGDMAVLRIANITRATSDFHRSRKGPIFMMIPVGSKPVSAAILPI